MKREKATDAQDLPHRYVNNCDGVCRVCHTGVLDARHLAWEKAAADEAPLPFARELGT